jgi:hypothetical protein
VTHRVATDRPGLRPGRDSVLERLDQWWQLTKLKARGPAPAPILLHGEDAGAWPVLAYAQRLNLDTRIGFEDTLEGPDRARRATSNEQLVRYALEDSSTPQRGQRSARSRRRAAHRALAESSSDRAAPR